MNGLAVHPVRFGRAFFCFWSDPHEHFPGPFQVVFGGFNGLPVQCSPSNIGYPPMRRLALRSNGPRLYHYDEAVMLKLAIPKTDRILTGAKFLGGSPGGKEDLAVVVGVKAQVFDESYVEHPRPHAHLLPRGGLHYLPSYSGPLSLNATLAVDFVLIAHNNFCFSICHVDLRSASCYRQNGAGSAHCARLTLSARKVSAELADSADK
jgi:hypothetical protein